MTARESPQFSRWADAIWSEPERMAVIDFVARNPTAGDLIPGTGGFRKLRWGVGGRGKRGGVRVIIYFFDESWPIYLALGYAKNENDNLSALQKAALNEIAKAIKSDARSKRGA
ncbi:MAG: type II toxin-antitoxin system RelE/ParE family toxin [Rhodospirillaceae bacterium]|nr:type II toxin-antitoxin system RelE/ParE family toxin [Rhodospirillaceae bacterium]